ncbi:peptidylprolyl isomerase [Actinacidiphila guanduensis]|uniref:Peptidyl-prolyl cis-trans isomerase B (Cyclophilin B) n=1 Tax=Actinacidiphila guanduensis TaxID=310781 RepID=A0A1H0KY73_9ACTN|nr:peptidylprolyl isomerase [Actinacidiphila guanduensis]SDO60746.1 peptidyl-prolyl cis-trans isomerase B (cyclophilin B) [Actinacidiphila guanduensis]
MVTKDQRRRQLAREKFARQQQRRSSARRKARVRNSVIAVVAVVIAASFGGAYAAGAFDSSGKKKDDAAASAPSNAPSGTPSATPTSKAPDPCAKPAAGKPGTKQWKKEPALTVDKSAKYTFTLDTTCGAIPISLDAAKAPHTVNSFAFLAGQHFFDHTKCHRLTTTGIYVLQCGDPQGTGQGGPGYTIPDENLNGLGKADSSGVVTYPTGTVAMANTGQAHTGGSQFFLVYKDSPLPPQYTPFGTISPAGMKVLNKIAAAGESTGQGDGAPNATVVINKATVTTS